MSRRNDIYTSMWRDLTGTEPDTLTKSAEISVDANRLRLALMGAAADRVNNRKLQKMLRTAIKQRDAFEHRAKVNAAFNPATEPSWSQVRPGYCPPGGAWVAGPPRSGVSHAETHTPQT